MSYLTGGDAAGMAGDNVDNQFVQVWLSNYRFAGHYTGIVISLSAVDYY